MGIFEKASIALSTVFSNRHVEREYHRATKVAYYEQWYKDDLKDRADGPALIRRDPSTGNVTTEAWYGNGKLHRADGPAITLYDSKTGAITRQEWFVDGKQQRVVDLRDPTDPTNAVEPVRTPAPRAPVPPGSCEIERQEIEDLIAELDELIQLGRSQEPAAQEVSPSNAPPAP